MRKTRNGYQVYPLTAAQKLHYYCLKYCPKKQVLNIGSSLTIEQDLDWNLLKEAIYQAYDRCESMRLRFTEDKEGNVYQYVADREERDIEHFDFTGWQECHAREKLEEWTQTPFDTYDCPRNRVVMIKMPDGFQGVYLLVDHLTMDAQSLIVFLKDVIELYCHMKYEGIDEPKPMASYIKQLEKDLAYEAGSDSQKREEAKALALVITGALGLTPLVEITSFFIMGVWALGESIVDVQTLLEGRKVPLLKSREDWALGVEQLLRMGQSRGSSVTSGGGKGLDYAGYLKLLLLLVPSGQKYYRMMDVMQMDIRLEQGGFLMKRCGYRVDMKTQVCGKHVFFALPFVEWESIATIGFSPTSARKLLAELSAIAASSADVGSWFNPQSAKRNVPFAPYSQFGTSMMKKPDTSSVPGAVFKI